jgi:hypothetical protein
MAAYLRSVGRHWAALVTGGAIVAARETLKALWPGRSYWWNRPVPAIVAWASLLLVIAVAQYLAWLDERAEVDRLRGENLSDLADTLALDKGLSPLTSGQRVNEAERQFRESLDGCRKQQTTESRRRLAVTAQRYLQIAKEHHGSQGAYSKIYADVQSGLRQFGLGR